jgi:hypothetical protein
MGSRRAETGLSLRTGRNVDMSKRKSMFISPRSDAAPYQE